MTRHTLIDAVPLNERIDYVIGRRLSVIFIIKQMLSFSAYIYSENLSQTAQDH